MVSLNEETIIPALFAEHERANAAKL